MDNKEIEKRIKFLLAEINELKKQKDVRPVVPLDVGQDAYMVFTKEDLQTLSSLIRKCLFGQHYIVTSYDESRQYLHRKPAKMIKKLAELSAAEYEAYCLAYKTCFFGIAHALDKIKDTGGKNDVAEEHEQAGHGDVHPGEPGSVS